MESPLENFNKVAAIGTTNEAALSRLWKLANRDTVQPISRALMPRETLRSVDQFYGRVDFFAVIPAGGNNVAIYYEGTRQYERVMGATREQLRAAGYC